MFNSAEPRREGYKDGWRNSPPYRGYYPEDAWVEYMEGYQAGRQDSPEAGPADGENGATVIDHVQ